MLFKVLAVGDVTGESGVDFLRRKLRPLKKEKDIDFVAVNGENAARERSAARSCGRTFWPAGRMSSPWATTPSARCQVANFLEENPYILRPANFTGRAPGRGWAVYDCGRVQVGVLNLIGRCDLDFNAENPFTTADRILKNADQAPPLCWWIFMPRPPAKSWRCATIWMAGCPPCGALIPMCPPPTPEFVRRAPGTSPTWA